jgi:hypothetical protein
VDKLYPGIGLKQPKGKPRSNSAISALSTDEFHEGAEGDRSAEIAADMASLQFTAPPATEALTA